MSATLIAAPSQPLLPAHSLPTVLVFTAVLYLLNERLSVFIAFFQLPHNRAKPRDRAANVVRVSKPRDSYTVPTMSVLYMQYVLQYGYSMESDSAQ